MIVRDAARLDIETVIHCMRSADAREVYAGRASEDPADLVDELVAVRPHCIGIKAFCDQEGEAIALIGARLRWPGVANVLMIATDRFPEIGLAATRWAKRVGLPEFIAPHAHRAQCEAWAENRASRQWLHALGFRLEAELSAYGKNRENFALYAWLRSG